MGEKKKWNDSFSANYSEKRKRDPLYRCDYNILYTQSVMCGSLANIDSNPLKADKYGYYHGTSL